eukprot:s465_g28.t1
MIYVIHQDFWLHEIEDARRVLAPLRQSFSRKSEARNLCGNIWPGAAPEHLCDPRSTVLFVRQRSISCGSKPSLAHTPPMSSLECRKTFLEIVSPRLWYAASTAARRSKSLPVEVQEESAGATNIGGNGHDAGAGARRRRAEGIVPSGAEGGPAGGKSTEQAASRINGAEEGGRGRGSEGRGRKRRHCPTERAKVEKGKGKAKRARGNGRCGCARADTLEGGEGTSTRPKTGRYDERQEFERIVQYGADEKTYIKGETFPVPSTWERVKRDFEESLTLTCGLPVKLAARDIHRAFGEEEASSEFNRQLIGTLGLPAMPLDPVPEVVEGCREQCQLEFFGSSGVLWEQRLMAKKDRKLVEIPGCVADDDDDDDMLFAHK